MAGKSGAPDLSVGECVRGVVRRHSHLLRHRGAHNDVQADAVEPAPHVAHGDAVLEEDDTLVGASALIGESILDEWVVDVGQKDGLSTAPGGIEARTGRIQEDESVLCKPVPVRAGAFDDENVPDVRGMGAGVTVQRFRIVAGTVMAVHVEPRAGPVGRGRGRVRRRRGRRHQGGLRGGHC